MSKPGRKTQETKQVSFRMPADVYHDYAAAAESRGVDLSALLNWVVTEFRPALLLREAHHAGAMLQAAMAMGLPQHSPTGIDLEEWAKGLTNLIAKLQDVASKLSAHTGAKAAKSAA
jgi:hypothetical protein